MARKPAHFALSTWPLLVGLACAPAIEHRTSPVAGRAIGNQAGGCSAAMDRARLLHSQGRLWSAKDLLAGCGDDAASLSEQIQNELGEARRPRVSAQGEDSELGKAEGLLAGGDCQGALAGARARYDARVPHPRAAILAGQAASCLHRPDDARRWYARAMFELELERGRAGWTLQPQPHDFSWQGPTSLAVETKAKLSGSLIAASSQGQWSWSSSKPKVERSGWLEDGVRVTVEGPGGGDLIGRTDASQAVVWRRALPDGAQLFSALGRGHLLVLARDPKAYQATYEEVELRTGRVLRAGKTEAVNVNNVVSAPFASWFSFETTDPQERETFAVLVDSQGRVRRQNVEKGCRALAALNSREFVSDCSEPRALFAIDAASGARRELVERPAGSFGHVETLREQVVSFSGSGGIFLLREDEKGPQVVAIPEASGVDWRSGISWSPDGNRFAAIGEVDGRSVFVIWNSATKRLEARSTGYLDRWPGHRIGFALSRDRSQLALGGCPELARFDLRSGAYQAAASGNCAPLLAPTSDTTFYSIGGKGDVLAWTPPAAPRPVAGQKFPDAPNQIFGSGNWLAVARDSISSPLLHVPSGQRLQLPEGRALRAISPDARHVVYETRRENNGVVERALVLGSLSETPPGIKERWRTPIQGTPPVLFSRDGGLLFWALKLPTGAQDWRQLDVSSLHARAAALGNAMTGAIELSLDGRSILSASRVSAGAQSLELGQAEHPAIAEARSLGTAFAAEDRLIVAQRDGSALLWRTRDARYLGRIEPLASGGALFTPGPARASTRAEPETQHLQLFGEAAPESLRCVVGDRLYEWQVCSDRYERTDLLQQTLEAAAAASSH